MLSGFVTVFVASTARIRSEDRPPIKRPQFKNDPINRIIEKSTSIPVSSAFLYAFQSAPHGRRNRGMSISANQIGDKIRVETTFKETISGEVYCFDKNAGILVLNILSCSVSELLRSFIFTEEIGRRVRLRRDYAEDGIH